MPYWGMYPTASDGPFGFYPAYLARSMTSHSSGQYYFEMTIVVAGVMAQVGIGIDNDAESLTNPAGQLGSVCWLGNGTVAYNGNAHAYLGSAYMQGAVLGVAANLTSGLVWFYNGSTWNNSPTANPASSTGGFSVAAVSPSAYALVQLSQTGDEITANFTNTPAFTYGAPSGFSAWD